MPVEYSTPWGLRSRIRWRVSHGWGRDFTAESLDISGEVLASILDDDAFEPGPADLASIQANLGNLADDEASERELGSSGEWAVRIYESPYWDALQIYSIRLPLGVDHFAWVYEGASEEDEPGQSDDFDPDDTDPYDAAESLVGADGFERLIAIRVYYTP